MIILKDLSKLIVLAIAVLLSFSSIVTAQKSLLLNVDTACFPEEGDSIETLLEVYYTLPRAQLRFVKSEDEYVAAMEITFRLEDAKGDSVDQVSWMGTTSISDLKELEDKEYRFYDTVPAFIKPGIYYITVSVNDTNSGMNGKVRKKIVVPDYTMPGLKLSQIQLAYTINDDNSDIPSVKDGKLIIPNASRIFAPEDNFIFFYAELHGLEFNSESPGKFKIDVRVLDASGNPYLDFYSSTMDKPGKSAVLSNGINGYALEDGSYQLQISAIDMETGSVASTAKSLQVKHLDIYSMNPLMRSLYEVHPETKEMKSEEDALLVKKQIEYIATVEELRTYALLTLDGKNRFMNDFWEKRDPDRKNDLNEFQIQHYARWDYANQSYATRSYQEGWLTDMGRVFIIHGPPADKEISGFQIDTEPYEIWFYYNTKRQGEAIFVFVDDQGHGDFRLFHSNLPGEKYVSEWREKLQTSKTIR